MDLDKLKNTWKNAEVPSSTIGEENIQQIIDSRGQTALDKLLKNEKIFLYIGIGCLLFLPLFWGIHIILFFVYAVLLVSGWIWQFYKIDLLKKINLQTMGILDVSSSIVRYKRLLVNEMVIGIAISVIFLSLYFIFGYPKAFGDGVLGDIFPIIWIASFFIVTLIVYIQIYRKAYWKNIKAIQSAINEIKSFKSEQ